MADVSKIKLPDGTELNITDKSSGYITNGYFLSWLEELPRTLYLMVSGSSCYLSLHTNAGSDPISYSDAVTYCNTRELYRIWQPITETEVREYELVRVDGTTQKVYLSSVEGDTIYNAVLQDSGSGLYGTISTVTVPTVPTAVSSFTNDAGYLTLSTLPIYDGTVTTS